MPSVEAADFVGAAAERSLQCRLIERLLAVIGLGEDRQPGDEQRRVARPLLSKAHHHSVVVGGFRAFIVAQLLGDDRVALFLQRIERPRHVMRSERRAVVEFRLVAQRKTVGQAVIGDAHALRRQPIHGVGLVARAHHQRREGVVHAEGALALEDVGIERIEGEKRAVVAAARHGFRIDAAFGRGRIDVFEVRKICRVSEIAEGRHAVPLALLRDGGRRQLRGGERADR